MVRLNENKGFTVPEILMASVTVMLVFLGIVGIYLMLQTVWMEGNARIDLQRQGRLAMECMARGAEGKDGIMKAVSADVSTPGSIKLDAGTREFYLDGSRIMYDPDTAVSDDEFTVAENVRTSPPGLTFSASGDIVTIKLNMEDQPGGRTVNVDLSTKVRLRNTG